MQIQIKDLVFDDKVYPRNSINETNVQSMIQSLKAGRNLPIIVIDAATKRIVDGFHRATALKRLYGEELLIEVEAHSYMNELELLMDASSRNASHGLKLQSFDISRVVVRGMELGATDVQLAAALSITVEKVNWHLIQRTRPHPDDVTKRVPIKSSQSWIPANSPMTARQMEGQKKLLGLHVSALAKKIIEALDSDNVNLDDANVLKSLAGLRDRLNLVSELVTVP